MPDKKKVYLPRMEVRAGQRHSYQGENVVIVDPKNRKEVSADDDAKVVSTEKAKK